MVKDKEEVSRKRADVMAKKLFYAFLPPLHTRATKVEDPSSLFNIDVTSDPAASSRLLSSFVLPDSSAQTNPASLFTLSKLLIGALLLRLTVWGGRCGDPNAPSELLGVLDAIVQRDDVHDIPVEVAASAEWCVQEMRIRDYAINFNQSYFFLFLLCFVLRRG